MVISLDAIVCIKYQRAPYRKTCGCSVCSVYILGHEDERLSVLGHRVSAFMRLCISALRVLFRTD